MIYVVNAVRKTCVYVEIEAASEEAAVEAALMEPRNNWYEVGNSEIEIQSVEPK